jgi:hypothetical protein
VLWFEWWLSSWASSTVFQNGRSFFSALAGAAAEAASNGAVLPVPSTPTASAAPAACFSVERSDFER